jgi:hypothetical protein
VRYSAWHGCLAMFVAGAILVLAATQDAFGQGDPLRLRNPAHRSASLRPSADDLLREGILASEPQYAGRQARFPAARLNPVQTCPT